MTIVSKMNPPNKPAAIVVDECTPSGEEKPTIPTPRIKAIMITKASPRRRRQQQQRRQISTVRASASLTMFIAVVVLIDVYAVLTTDPDCPGPLTQFTGLHPTFNIYMLIVLHMMTLFGGLSKTVNGCRLAMGIAWMFFLISVVLLVFVPAFLGSYVASGLAPVQNITLRADNTAQDRFQTAFYMAIGGQLFVFLLFMCTIFQLTLVGELLAESHVIEMAARYARAGVEIGGDFHHSP
ncbi:hypothetical protein GCK72_009582 [Caenorhabditis remanei]|uniref:Uncharacterized protein n=1 Tax=Caenorhabditis remanei TaxID=31234 RepID=A0A6A5H3B2_CAERE|nr:hypothetical protein GCK72_009582 [Caenorhabditis remanei]KAF1761326.1 hypothetical protein GCK72_009582 [Caenorhabditis remanei]